MKYAYEKYVTIEDPCWSMRIKFVWKIAFLIMSKIITSFETQQQHFSEQTNYFPIQQSLLGFYKRHEFYLVRGKN